MQAATRESKDLAEGQEVESRPGLTSLVRTGRGLMTVQTELVGESTSLELVTIVDFRGRVLKTWRSPFALHADDVHTPEQIRRRHHDIEARVREKLASVAQRRPESEATGTVVAHLFVEAMRAYGERDFSTARALLRACELLQPAEARIRTGIECLRGRHLH